MAEREEKILDLLSRGFSRNQVGEAISAQYNCTHLAAVKQYDKIVRRARVVGEDEKEDARTVIISRYDFLYQEAVNNGQIKTAADVLEKKMKALGLYDKQAGKEEAPQILITGKPDLTVVPGKDDKDAKEK